MTSVIAWLAVDSRHPTALYFASDSRQTFPDGDHSDSCIKLYAVDGGHDIFAFSGDVDFAIVALRAACEGMEAGAIPAGLATSAYGKAEWLRDQFNKRLEAAVMRPRYRTSILHGTRQSWGQTATFVIHRFSIEAAADRVACDEVLYDQDGSSVVTIDGSGTVHVGKHVSKEAARAGNFSRAFFAGFCESIVASKDPCSGGPIQLVGIGDKGVAMHFGVVTSEGAFFRAAAVTDDLPSVKWRDAKLQNVDRFGNLIRGAQVHAW